MSGKAKNITIAILCAVIAGALGLSAYTLVNGRRSAGGPNPNVTLVAAPEQTDFEAHPDWALPEVEEVDYGENLAEGKTARQNGQAQVYNCRNALDGNRYTYWEGAPDSYPSVITIDLEEVMDLGGAQLLLSPNQIWSARTQEVEVLVSGDGEEFTSVVPRTAYTFDPLENNCAYIPLAAGTRGQYVQFSFYSNTEAKAGQVAEIEIYGPQE